MIALLISGSLMACAAALYIAVYLLADLFQRAKLTQTDWRVQRVAVIALWWIATCNVLAAILTLHRN